MYFEGISACVSLTTKHVYCVTPCQLNRLLLFLVTIGIKIGKIKETNGFNRGNKSWFWDEKGTWKHPKFIKFSLHVHVDTTHADQNPAPQEILSHQI